MAKDAFGYGTEDNKDTRAVARMKIQELAMPYYDEWIKTGEREQNAMWSAMVDVGNQHSQDFTEIELEEYKKMYKEMGIGMGDRHFVNSKRFPSKLMGMTLRSARMPYGEE
tara:strand:+ start:2079 stop:2411 length:333 start_codon:yes stop_codon:yes gene_type:complete